MKLHLQASGAWAGSQGPFSVLPNNAAKHAGEEKSASKAD